MYAIGTTDRYGNFDADTLGNDPQLTTFASEDAALAAIRSLIDSGSLDPDQPLADAAILDTETGQITWRQEP
jgi:hypothetical protein